MRSMLRATCAALVLAAVPVIAADPPAPAPATAAAPGFLGIGLDEVDEALAYHLDLKNDLGVMVTEVAPGSAAAAMGVVTYDIIVGCDGQPIYTPRALSQAIRAKHAGDTVTLEIRRGAKTVAVNGTLAARPPEADAGPMRHGPRMPFAGPDRRRGSVRQPDGSTMEWSVEDTPEPPCSGPGCPARPPAPPTRDVP